MAAKKKKKKAKKAVGGRTARPGPARRAKKSKKASKRSAKKTAKRPAQKATKKSTKKATRTAAKKAPARKVPSRGRKPAAKKKKQIVGEGDYAASRAFLKDQARFVEKNRGKIPAMGREAADALEGPQGDTLRSAEADAADRSRDTP